MNINEAFEIFGLEKNASEDKIKEARKDLISIWHPDRFSSKNQRLKKKAEEKIRELNIAYDTILSWISEEPEFITSILHQKDLEK